MAQAHSAALETAWAAKDRTLHVHVEVCWDGATWTDETAYVLEITTEASLYDPQLGLPGLGRGQPGSAVLTLSNEGSRYSPDNAGSPLHANIASGIYRVPIRIDASYETSPAEDALRQFTGYIEAPHEWAQPGARMVQFSCLDAAEATQQVKASTEMLVNKRPDELLDTLLHLVTPLPSHSLDRGLSVIPWAWVDDENVWGECQAIAEADGGAFYCGKDGSLKFEHMTHWLEASDHTAVQATLDTGNAWWLEDTLSWRNCYTGVIVEYAPRYAGGSTEIYRAIDTIEVPPGGDKLETCRFRYPALSVETPVAATTKKQNDYTVVNAGMAQMASSLTLTPTKYAQRADLRLQNAHASQALYILGLKLKGVPVLGDEAQEVRLNSSLGAIPGEKIYSLRGNPYIQTEAQANRLAAFLRDRLERPRRLLGWRGPGVPWLELGDRVHIDDAAAGISTDAFVLSLRQSIRANGPYEAQIMALPVANLFPSAPYFVLGGSEWGDPSAPAFY